MQSDRVITFEMNYLLSGQAKKSYQEKKGSNTTIHLSTAHIAKDVI